MPAMSLWGKNWSLVASPALEFILVLLSLYYCVASTSPFWSLSVGVGFLFPDVQVDYLEGCRINCCKNNLFPPRRHRILPPSGSLALLLHRSPRLGRWLHWCFGEYKGQMSTLLQCDSRWSGQDCLGVEQPAPQEFCRGKWGLGGKH